jgi:Ca2+-binding RTX toxin-like protein
VIQRYLSLNRFFQRRKNSRGRKPRELSQPIRRLCHEHLEDRSLLAVLWVTTAADSGGGSLREAIAQANSASGADTVQFAPELANQTITLTLGQLRITDDLTITGLGTDQLTISGNRSSRIFEVTSPTVEIKGLSLVDGQATEGGAILNWSGNVRVEDCTLARNSATTGGAIRSHGTLTVTNSTLEYNSSPGPNGSGGGIWNYGGSATVTNSTLAHNSAGYCGGGIFNADGPLTVTNSTLAYNSANFGGGILNWALGTLTVTNSTLAYNSAAYLGGGIRDEGGGTLTITNSLVGANTALSAPDVETLNTIADARYNVIQDGASSGIVGGVNGNQVGVDPLLDPAGLQDSGGPTQTIALMAGSPAINSGSNALAVDPAGAPLQFDQRGAGYARVASGTVDVGAFEVQIVPDEPSEPGETETLNGLIDYILSTFNHVPPASEVVFRSGGPIPGTEEIVPLSVQIGSVPAALGDGSDLQLDNITLTFPTNLTFHSSTNTWSGGVGVTAMQGVLFPGLLDIGVIDDAFDKPRRVKSATVEGQQTNGKYEVVFTLAGDHRDLWYNRLLSSKKIAVLNSNPPTFDDLDLADDTKQIVVTLVNFREGRRETDVTVHYNFDPGSSWIGGSLLAAQDPDTGDDSDAWGVVGTIPLQPGDSTSVLKFDTLEAADIGFPRWLDIAITGLQMEFTDFRDDDSDNVLRMNSALRGFETGNYLLNEAIRNNPLLQLNVEGNATGIEFDMDRLAEGYVLGGVVTLPKNPITDISGISGKVTGSIFGVGSVSAGFILKQVAVNEQGEITTVENEIAETAVYGAVAGSVSFGGTDDGKGGKKGAFSAGLNLAVSELGPLQFFVYSGVPILLEPVTGLAITELRGGVRFNSNIEDLQVRPPLGTTAGKVSPFQDGADVKYRVTLTAPGHNLKIGDEFRIIDAAEPYKGRFKVTEVDGDDITYVMEDHPGAYAGANIRKITISDPLDLRDPGFASTKDLSLSDWENQLDQAVANQMNAGDSFWDVLFDKAVIEAGATLSFSPRIPSNVLSIDGDLLFDTEGRFLVTGGLNLPLYSVPAKLYADFSEGTEGAQTYLFLADIPEGVKPLLVARAGATFEALIDGVPVTHDEITGFPSGVGIDVASASVDDLSGIGAGPWNVTYTLNPASGFLSDVFAVGHSITVIKSDPDTFDGTHAVQAINDEDRTITVRVGAKVIGGELDMNLDGRIDSSDHGYYRGIPVIDGALDMNRDGTIDEKDHGEVFTFIQQRVVGYAVIAGKVDIDGDKDVDDDVDDDGVLGRNPGVLIAGGVAANLNDLGDGFRISVEGGIDLNIPFVTTITLEGSAQLDFTVGTGDTDARIDLAFDAALSESNVGTIARANGAFHVTIDANLFVDAGGDADIMLPKAEVWGAAVLDTDFGFLEPIGLFANAEGLLRINSSKVDKPDEVLKDVDGNPLPVALPAESFALRLDGGIDFRIDFNGNGTFAESESVFQIGGIFVLEFSAEGFNVAIFDERNNVVVPAGLTLGPKNRPLLEFGVLGFMAIRRNGLAADLVLTANASLPLDLASIDATAVFIVNTTGEDVVFEIPGGATDPNRPSGLSVTIPDAPPANPSGILNHSQPGAGLDALITGSPTWEEVPDPGPYGVVFLAGELKLLSILELDVSGYVLLSKDVVSLEANYSAKSSFFNLASASVHGTLFFSSQGEFVVDVGGNIQLGPDGFNISGSAHLVISHLDSDGRGSQGDGHFVLDIHGSLAVSAEIFYIDVGSVSVDVAYNSSVGVITVGIEYPQVYWAKSCKKVWLVGTVCVYYPSIKMATYTFEVGKLKVESPVLGQVDANGLLTLNVGPQASARHLAVSEVNEDVVIADVSAGSQRGRKIGITMFGLTQTFDNVTRVLTPDMGNGNDTVTISEGVVTEVEVHLGDGDDRLVNAGSASVIAYGGEGDDQLYGGVASDQLFGGPGNDVIAGGGGQDLLDGGAGDDEFIVMANNLDGSQIIGGEGQDKISIVRDASVHELRVTVNDNAGEISSYSDNVEMGSVTFANIERIILSSGFEHEDFDQEAFVLWGDGQVYVNGSMDDDEITVTSGSVVVTTNGITTTFSGSAVDGIVVDGQDGDDVILVDASVFIPTVLFGGNGDDIIQGGSGDNIIDGGEGNDQLDGGAGNSTVRFNNGDVVAVKEGHTFNAFGSFPDPQNAAIDWGDESMLQDGTIADGTVSASHVYADNGEYRVTVQVMDGELGLVETIFNMVVENVAPTLELDGQTVTDDQGRLVSLPLATFHDFGTADTHTTTIDWGDGIVTYGQVTVTEPPFELPGAVGTITGSHVYAADGNFTVTVTLSDDDGGTDIGTFTVTVLRSIFVLSSTARDALDLSGNATLTVPGSVFVNSACTDRAVDAGGNSRLIASQIEVVGGVRTTGNAVLSSDPVTGVQPISDPLATLAAPHAEDFRGSAVYAADSEATLQPGVYTQIKASGDARLILEPGIYVIRGGGLQISDNASLTGTGVLIYNAGSNYPDRGGTFGSISLSGAGAVGLTPLGLAGAGDQPLLAGLILFQARDNNKAISISGNSSGMEGTIYAPAAMLTLSGNAPANGSLIVNRLNLTGNAGSVTPAPADHGLWGVMPAGHMTERPAAWSDPLPAFARHPQRTAAIDAVSREPFEPEWVPTNDSWTIRARDEFFTGFPFRRNSRLAKDVDLRRAEDDEDRNQVADPLCSLLTSVLDDNPADNWHFGLIVEDLFEVNIALCRPPAPGPLVDGTRRAEA